jgi:DNA-binding CsgD family transcriptional regulator/tetratricopeptide (TPR) repeat protein
MFSPPPADTQREDPERETNPSAFIGREEQLALAARRWQAATNGAGHFLLVAGEAGIGKTRLLGEIAAAISGAKQLTAAVFPRDIEAVGGLILDLALALGRANDAGTASALRDRLTAGPDASGDRSRSRRILVSDLAGTVTTLLSETPTLLRIEDLHWADELSLDVLERVATTLAQTSSMILGTYRSDELYPRTPLRRLRSRLLEQRLAEEVRLPRLDAAQTDALIRSLTGGTQSSDTINSVLDRSDGIPLYVEELLSDRTSVVPATIADAVIVQRDSLAATTIPVLEAAAVIGRSFAIDLLEAVAGGARDETDIALGELADRNLVLAGADGATLDFRHALIRDAIYENISPLRKRDLHARVADVAVEFGFGDSFVSDQYERARRPADAYRYAILAARGARQLSSHREAVELFRRAQRTAPGELPQSERAALYAELAEVLAATDDNEAAATQLESAINLYRTLGDEVAAAILVPRLAAVRHLLGVSYDSRATLLDDELHRIDGLTPPAPVPVRAALLAALAAAYMLDRCLDDATEAGTAAAALADEGGALDERIDIDLTLGSVLVFAGPGSDGWPMLESAIAKARELQFEAQAARGYRMIGSSASVLVEYERAERWIGEGLDYTSITERWNDFHYLDAHLAHVRWARGEWDDAKAIASRALDVGRGGVTTRNTALIVLGYLALGRGDFGTARIQLGEAREIGERMHELQRLVPALWGLAETELLAGDPASAAGLAEVAYSNSEPIGDAAYIFPFLTTGVRAYLALHDAQRARDWFDRCAYLLRYRGIPGTLPAIAHAEGLLLLAEGQTGAARALLEEAHAGWVVSDRYWDAARSAIDLAHCAARSRRPRDAAGLVDETRQRATAIGATAILSLAHAVADGGVSAGPLSARELDVARLVAAGSTNREIAERLVISPKTASSHIEHILAKLGVARRSEIAAWMARTEP